MYTLNIELKVKEDLILEEVKERINYFKYYKNPYGPNGSELFEAINSVCCGYISQNKESELTLEVFVRFEYSKSLKINLYSFNNKLYVLKYESLEDAEDCTYKVEFTQEIFSALYEFLNTNI